MESKKFSVGPAMDELPGNRDRRWYEIRTCTPPPSGEDDEEDEEEEQDQGQEDADGDADVEMSGTGEVEGSASLTAGKGSLSVGGRSMSEQEDFKSQQSVETEATNDMLRERLQRLSNVTCEGSENRQSL